MMSSVEEDFSNEKPQTGDLVIFNYRIPTSEVSVDAVASWKYQLCYHEFCPNLGVGEIILILNT